MATITITGTVTDSAGASATFSTTASTDAVAVTSVNVTPSNAVPGTMRTLTVLATSSSGLALTINLDPISGVTFTPVPGQPAGTFVWTFVF